MPKDPTRRWSAEELDAYIREQIRLGRHSREFSDRCQACGEWVNSIWHVTIDRKRICRPCAKKLGVTGASVITFDGISFDQTTARSVASNGMHCVVIGTGMKAKQVNWYREAAEAEHAVKVIRELSDDVELYTDAGGQVCRNGVPLCPRGRKAAS